MKLFQTWRLFIFLSISSTAISKYAKTGCNDKCGNVTIPYPFGIGADCSINPWYTVDCISSTPYLSALDHLEVLRVDLNNQTVIVSAPKISDCRNPVHYSIDLRSTPFLFCSYHNRFVFDGCGNAVMMDNGSLLTGCSTSCRNDSVRERNNDCFGFSCCQTTIPHFIKYYSINLVGLGGDQGCGYAFLVDDDSYLLGSFSIQSVANNNASVPMSLMWTLPRSPTLSCCREAADHMNMELDTGNGTSVESQKCYRHIGYKGNPYLSDGCEVIEDCASCPYSSSCNYDIIYGSNGSSTKVINFSCGPNISPTSIGSKSSMDIILGVRKVIAVYLLGRFSVQSVANNNASVPMSLMWTLPRNTTLNCCREAADHMNMELDTGNGTSVESQKCYRHIGYKGNPYLSDGCEVIEDCASCPYSSSCNYDIIYGGDGSSTKVINFSCGPNISPKSIGSKSSMGIILGVSISLGAFFLVAVIYALYKWIKKTKENRQRKRFFKQNGGLLLKQQEETDPSLVGKTILFTSHELEKATDNFNENRILGRGGQGTVYKGMLVDGRIVAIKKSKVVDESRLQQFINEVVVLSQVNHRNVVKLLGCCLETAVPLLVSEFIPNGTLYDHLHNETNDFSITLNMRLQIATEVAGALAYLHSATSIPIYHRDIKTTNILLDDKYRAKISDFGTSRFVSVEQTHLTTLVKGTFGYLDPEYFQSSQFTKKSDVYSFGVVLVELLTGERPISLTRFGEHRSLATYFMLAMEEGRVMSIFDVVVIKEGTRDELLILANLAMRCLSLNGRYRPTMKEVVIELENVRMSHVPSKIQTNTKPMIYGEDLSFVTYSDMSSTF